MSFQFNRKDMIAMILLPTCQQHSNYCKPKRLPVGESLGKKGLRNARPTNSDISDFLISLLSLIVLFLSPQKSLLYNHVMCILLPFLFPLNPIFLSTDLCLGVITQQYSHLFTQSLLCQLYYQLLASKRVSFSSVSSLANKSVSR